MKYKTIALIIFLYIPLIVFTQNKKECFGNRDSEVLIKKVLSDQVNA